MSNIAVKSDGSDITVKSDDSNITVKSDGSVIVIEEHGPRTLVVTDSTLTGIGTIADPLSVSGNIKEVTSTYLTLITDANIYLKGSFNVNLHSLSIATRILTFKVALQGADTITLVADGSDLIEGSATYVMNSDEGLLLIPTTDGWEIL